MRPLQKSAKEAPLVALPVGTGRGPEVDLLGLGVVEVAEEGALVREGGRGDPAFVGVGDLEAFLPAWTRTPR